MKALALAAILIASFPTLAGPKPKGPCSIFFQMGEKDIYTSQQIRLGMKDEQGHWWIGYEDHGKGNGWFRGHENEGKYAGICFLRGEMPMAQLPPNAAVYSIVWGVYSYDSLYQGTTVTHLFTGGTISVWDYSANGGRGDFVQLGQIITRDFNQLLGDPYVDVLKRALQQIIDAQKPKTKEPWQN